MKTVIQTGMTKILKALVLAVTFAGVTQSARAALVSVEDVFDPGKDVFLDSSGDRSYKWGHDIKDNGFNPTTDTILSASLSLGLRDDQARDGGESVKIRLDGDLFGSFKVNVGTAYSQTSVWVDVDYLQQDGKLTVKLTATSGDFYLVDSTLKVTWDHPTVGAATGGGSPTVPEPGTALLLGLGIAAAGLGISRKKRS